MLSSPTPFPQVGSYALLDLDGTKQLARIQSAGPDWGPEDIAFVSLPLVVGSSGNRRVGLGDLIDGTPLTPAEAEELDGLCMRGLAAAHEGLHPRRNLSERQRARFTLLSDRAGHARMLDRLMEELGRRQAAAQRWAA